MNYRKDTAEMFLFQKYEIFYYEIGHHLRFYIKKIACRYYA